jgi:hypothetical protein
MVHYTLDRERLQEFRQALDLFPTECPPEQIREGRGELQEHTFTAIEK